MEGRVVRFADKIAYINHDIDDAIRAGVILESDIPKEISDFLGNSKSKRITSLVNSIINNSVDDIKMDSETENHFLNLHEFLFTNVYRNPVAKSEETKVDGIIKGIFNFYIEKPDRLPVEYLDIIKKEGLERAVADYIAGMTDHYAISFYSNIYIPKSWGI